MQLSREQLNDYHSGGYLVVEDIVPPEEVEALRNRVREYTHEGRPLGSIRAQIEPRVQQFASAQAAGGRFAKGMASGLALLAD